MLDGRETRVKPIISTKEIPISVFYQFSRASYGYYFSRTYRSRNGIAGTTNRRRIQWISYEIQLLSQYSKKLPFFAKAIYSIKQKVEVLINPLPYSSSRVFLCN